MILSARVYRSSRKIHLFPLILRISVHLAKKLFQNKLNNICNTWHADNRYIVQ